MYRSVVDAQEGGVYSIEMSWNRNWTGRSGFMRGQTFVDSFSTSIGLLGFFDNGGFGWRYQMEPILLERWAMKNPGKIPTNLIWEDYGRVNNRSISFEWSGLNTGSYPYARWSQHHEDGFGLAEAQEMVPPAIPEIEFWLLAMDPSKSVGMEVYPDPSQEFYGDGWQITWALGQVFSPPPPGELPPYFKLATFAGKPGQTVTADIPDVVFDRLSILAPEYPGFLAVTKSLNLWLVPVLADAPTDTRWAGWANIGTASTRGEPLVTYSYAPPRYAIEWYVDDVPPEPPTGKADVVRRRFT